MSHSFVAYIDEAGDEGFKFTSEPDASSSEWFVLAACVIRMSNHLRAMRFASDFVKPIETLRKSPIHWKSLSHDAKVGMSACIRKMPVRLICVAINKRALAALPEGHTLRGNRRLYFYYTRYLLERISWTARDNAKLGQGDGTCKCVFAHAKNLSYDRLRNYLKHLQETGPTKIAWNHLGPIEVSQPKDNLGLRVADCVASGIAAAFELGKHGYCEDRYLRFMKKRIYRNTNYLSYGLKIVPSIPKVEPLQDNRYAFLEWFK